ncbi:hypothetical protein Taro_053998, partial [Colocasia esculenta]|nr:hypothetical protein [Colocasia esculenta]
MAAQGYAEGQLVTKPPFFDGEEYQYWMMRMECFIRGTDFDLWQTGQPEKSKKKHKKFMAAAWENEEATSSKSSRSESEKEQ